MEDLFGKPGEGFHSVRFLGYALYDVIGTIVIAIIISYFTKYKFIWVLLILFVVAEFLHWYFGVKTKFIKQIGI
jgi:hypothetical protein